MMNRTLVVLVENKPGVLNRVASLFRKRNFNIDSLTVGRTENPDVSRMTIVVEAQDADQVQKQLYKLVNVIQVEEVSSTPNVSRDLALIKVYAGSEKRGEVMQVCEIFGARVLDACPSTMIVEVTGEEREISSLVELLQPIGIAEMVRTGVVSMTRGEHVLQPVDYKPFKPANGNGHRATVL